MSGVEVITFGCRLNTYESEVMRAEAEKAGLNNAVLVNTCAVTGEAVRQARQAIRRARRDNPHARIIVTGCAAQTESAAFAGMPEVDAVLGNEEKLKSASYRRLPDFGVSAEEKLRVNDIMSVRETAPQMVKLIDGHVRAFVQVQNGCDHRCTFCIIPSMRGDLDSRAIGEVLDEAKRLVEAGVKELLVISQDTSAYGVDVKHRTGFWNGAPVKTSMVSLCEQLAKLGVWVRLHYVYPYPHVDDVIPLMAEGKILPYLDIPLQHASPRILKLMKRPGAVDKTLERVQRWRQLCPDITVRSTFIVGFPGETEAEFEELLSFLDEAQLDRVGAFAYSPVTGATANDLPGAVPEEVKQERLARFMARQAEISAARLEAKIGTVQQCLVDAIEDGIAVARSKADAPEIDGLVHIQNADEAKLRVGQFVNVEITESDDHDLYGDALIEANAVGRQLDLKVL